MRNGVIDVVDVLDPGKTYTMLGVDDSPQNLGIVPCAISWLFRLIEDLKEKTGSRFSVRVSAVEVTGRQETLKDLLANIDGSESSCALAEARIGLLVLRSRCLDEWQVVAGLLACSESQVAAELWAEGRRSTLTES